MIKKETVFKGANNRAFAVDYRYLSEPDNKPVVVFLHGFKGFKDWGHFNMLADYLAQKGFAAVKLNFSHNGTTPEHPGDFVDLEAFGKNTLGKELEDVQALLNTLFSDELFKGFDREHVFLLGHSRGGATAVLAAARDERIKGLATLSSIADLEKRFSKEQYAEWEKNKVIYIPNARIKKDMPVYVDLIDEYRGNDQMNILKNEASLKVPHLVLHGSDDETVGVEEAEALSSAGKRAHLKVIDGANHTFGGKHPYGESQLPGATVQALDSAVNFFRDLITGEKK